ncbi:MAG: pitrilysin family protein [Bacteroidota bacterium]
MNHQLYYEQDLRVPMTHLTMVFNGAGVQQEPEEKTGLARFTAKMLFRGTPALSREAISQKFELLGAEVNASVSETDFVVSISCFTKNLVYVLDLVLSVVHEAGFPQQELDLLKKTELNQLEAALQNPERVLSAANQYFLYDGTRFGRIGSKNGIADISRQDIVDFFLKVRGASVLYFTSISDLSQHEVEGRIERFMVGRSVDGFELKPETPFKEADGRNAFIVQSTDAKNDRLIWTQKGIGATDDRRFELSLVIDALGSFEGFLFDELRNKKGWCYGAYAFIVPATTRPGRIGFYADPSLETSNQLIPELLRLIRVFSEEKDFQERLLQRNTTFKNRYPYQLDLKFKLSSRVSKDRYGIPILGKEAYNSRIDAVTEITAGRAIDELFDDRNLTMVFYGDADRIQRILAGCDSSVRCAVIEKGDLIA